MHHHIQLCKFKALWILWETFAHALDLFTPRIRRLADSRNYIILHNTEEHIQGLLKKLRVLNIAVSLDSLGCLCHSGHADVNKIIFSCKDLLFFLRALGLNHIQYIKAMVFQFKYILLSPIKHTLHDIFLSVEKSKSYGKIMG